MFTHAVHVFSGTVVVVYQMSICGNSDVFEETASEMKHRDMKGIDEKNVSNRLMEGARARGKCGEASRQEDNQINN